MNIHMPTRDKHYWEQYYADQKIPFSPSLFSQYILERVLKTGDSLIELGCGNGRDAVYLAHHGIHVTAIDQCEQEIGFLAKKYGSENLKFLVGDFTELNNSFKVDHVYSRFTMHSVTLAGQTNVLRWAADALPPGGRFYLEFRGKKNELFGLGDSVSGEDSAFIYENHYRRFIDIHDMIAQLIQNGFEISEATEQSGFSPYNNDDETFVRIIARKL